MNACTICRRPTNPEREPIRHNNCADRLRADLVAIPGLYALMGAILAPGAIAGGGRVSGNTRTTPLPLRLEPLSLRARGGLITTLALWETHIRAERGLSAGVERGITDRDLAAIVLFLRAQLTWTTEHYSQTEKFATDLRDIVHDCRAAAGILPNLQRIGDCPNPLADGDPCGTALFVDPYAEEIRCQWCRRTWSRPQWVPLGKRLRGEEEDRSDASQDADVPAEAVELAPHFDAA